jgi:hypothetical protein
VIPFGTPTDYWDEYLRILEDTAIKCVRRFTKVMIGVFGPEYLRARPNKEDANRLMNINKKKGFTDMLRSIYCMKNFPKVWHEQ